jgi:hypothetical protein
MACRVWFANVLRGYDEIKRITRSPEMHISFLAAVLSFEGCTCKYKPLLGATPLVRHEPEALRDKVQVTH